MAKEYRTITEIAGPLIFVEKTEPVGYNELVGVPGEDVALFTGRGVSGDGGRLPDGARGKAPRGPGAVVGALRREGQPPGARRGVVHRLRAEGGLQAGGRFPPPAGRPRGERV